MQDQEETLFEAAVEAALVDVQDYADHVDERAVRVLASLRQLALLLDDALDTDDLIVEFDEEILPPAIQFNHRGGETLAELRGDAPGVFVFQSLSDFPDLDQQYFRDVYFIYSDISQVPEDMLQKLAQLLVQFEMAVMRAFSDEEED